MKPTSNVIHLTFTVVASLLVLHSATMAQDGKLKIHVTPPQAYVFVDGHAIGEASKHHSINLSAGDHKLDLANYGYAMDSRSVTITAGQDTTVDATLTPVASKVSSPFGAMTIEGAGRDAILLNGKSPAFFVGHGDEFNHDWWWKQELVVPPGNYQVTVLEGDQTKWSGPVEVPANKRVVLSVPNGVRKTVDWKRGEQLSSIPRFSAGTASATVAVSKPTAQLSASAENINCGDSSQLKWNSTDAPTMEITPVGAVAASGEQSVQPKENTTYNLTAVGPGGTVTQTATVNVNSAIQANLQLAPGEVHYRRIGDKVMQDAGTALNWNVSNASSVSIDPLGTVDASGNRSLQLTPRKTDTGAVDEQITYTLNARNDCGGTETKTATLHLVGSIEPEPQVALRSVYFPTDLPRGGESQTALLPSEQATLTAVAESFKKYLEYKPDARLALAGHADERGPQEYNQPLSERRVQDAKAFLIQQGVPEASIDTNAYGKEKNLSDDEVKQLVQQNSDLTDELRQQVMQRLHTIALAYNRRVDITLTPTGQESIARYPFAAEDYAKLVDRNGPNKPSAEQPAALKEKIAN
ncbi:MAG TPA: OmpA family protein [Candidatus Sulfotelmatobacter sp.]|nr:OmpA family protein [Candidatus Sulfotelmatobacter sp.]